jgi:hypothetical protein
VFQNRNIKVEAPSAGLPVRQGRPYHFIYTVSGAKEHHIDLTHKNEAYHIVEPSRDRAFDRLQELVTMLERVATMKVGADPAEAIEQNEKPDAKGQEAVYRVVTFREWYRSIKNPYFNYKCVWNGGDTGIMIGWTGTVQYFNARSLDNVTLIESGDGYLIYRQNGSGIPIARIPYNQMVRDVPEKH